MHISIYVCLYVGRKGMRLKEFIMAVAICRLEIIYRKIKKRIQNIMTFHLIIFYLITWPMNYLLSVHVRTAQLNKFIINF